MLENKTALKVLSLLTAIALWAFVLGEVNPSVKKTIYDVPVELTNVEQIEAQGLALTTEDDYTVDVVVEGARSDVNKLDPSDIKAVADVYGYKKGENHVSVDVTVPNRISLEEVKTPEIIVVLEDMVSVSMPVTVEFTSTENENLEPSLIDVTPSEVQVKGAESVVSRVDSVRVQIDSAELTETGVTLYETPSAWSKKDKLIRNVSISAGTVEVNAIMHHAKVVELELKVTGDPKDDPEITVPKEVTIKGTASALERITAVTAKTIDISDIDETKTVPVEVSLPYGVELGNASVDVGVKIEFK